MCVTEEFEAVNSVVYSWAETSDSDIDDRGGGGGIFTLQIPHTGSIECPVCKPRPKRRGTQEGRICPGRKKTETEGEYTPKRPLYCSAMEMAGESKNGNQQYPG